MLISHIIVFLFVFCIFVTGLISSISLIENRQAMNYTLKNNIYMESLVDVSHETIITHSSKQTGFDNVMAKGCCEMIENVYSNHIDIDGMVLHKTFTYDRSDKIPFGCILTKGDIIFIVLRGTLNNVEWVNNLKFYQAGYRDVSYKNIPTFMNTDDNIKVHGGHLLVYDKIFPYIYRTIRNLQKNHDYQVCLAGHSMGGCASLILTAELSFRGYDVITYVFGCPRTGNVDFSNYIKNSSAKVYRIDNTEDIVPHMMVPIAPNIYEKDKAYFYSHCGEVFYFTKSWFSVWNNHSIQMYRSFF